MGVGMVVITAPQDVHHITASAATFGINAWECGSVVKGSGLVRLDGVVT
jgi:phosphoribosylaminoimidazole (AIR) synthetase